MSGFRNLLVILMALAVASCIPGSAKAGVMNGKLRNRIDIPLLMSSFDGVSGELRIRGLALLKDLSVPQSVYRFELDANFTSDGQFNLDQKGAFSVSNGSVVLLKGTITEASGSVFGPRLSFASTMDIGGHSAALYGSEVTIRVELSPIFSASRALQMAVIPTVSAGTGEIGRAVPEPSSLAAVSSLLLLGLVVGRRRLLSA